MTLTIHSLHARFRLSQSQIQCFLCNHGFHLQWRFPASFRQVSLKPVALGGSKAIHHIHVYHLTCFSDIPSVFIGQPFCPGLLTMRQPFPPTVVVWGTKLSTSPLIRSTGQARELPQTAGHPRAIKNGFFLVCTLSTCSLGQTVRISRKSEQK